jgi:ubiquinol-cytochrome c reductase cytochrome c1 subunit
MAIHNKIIYSLILILLAGSSFAASEAQAPKQMRWPFEGVFGKFDHQAAQRGAQIYMEVCSTCHALNHLYYRNLADLGFSAEEIKEIAHNKRVIDGPDSTGEMFERPAVPSDRFVSPFANEEAARASNNGAYPVDLSLIVKARADGANYLYSLLTGYQEPPEGLNMMPGLYYNPYFEGGQIAMPTPLVDSQVEYMDGTTSSVHQMAYDLTVFLQWAAEPEMEHRKSMGLKVMLFLIAFTILFYIVKKNTWRKIK